MILLFVGQFQYGIPQGYRDSLAKAGIDKDSLAKAGLDSEGMITSAAYILSVNRKTGQIMILPVKGQWCKVSIRTKEKHLLPDIEFKNGGFGLIKEGELYIEDGTLARLNGSIYRFSGGTWTKQKSE